MEIAILTISLIVVVIGVITLMIYIFRQPAFPATPQPTRVTLRLFHWEDDALELSQGWDFLLDWSEYFDRRAKKVPEPSIWQERLIPELEGIQKKIHARKHTQRVCFYPPACLSAGLAFGWTFSEVKGYTLEVLQGHEIWRTDAPYATNRSLVVTELTPLDESSRELCVEFSHAADVTPKVDVFIKQTDKSFRARLKLTPDQGIGARIDGSTALAYANNAKQQIRSIVDKYGCDKIHLFYAGPLGLAIFLGRLFNAMHADIQCYEEQQVGYAPTCLLRG